MAKRIPLTPELAAKALLIGARIRAERDKNGYTQAKLALKIGKTSGAIGQYETGRNLPNMQTLERLAKELSVTTEWLMTGDDPGEEIKAHTTSERDALHILREIPTDLHEAALAMLRGLTKTKEKKE